MLYNIVLYERSACVVFGAAQHLWMLLFRVCEQCMAIFAQYTSVCRSMSDVLQSCSTVVCMRSAPMTMLTGLLRCSFCRHVSQLAFRLLSLEWVWSEVK